MDDPLAPLLTRVARQDRAAFRELYADAGSKLYGVLLRILRDRAESDDALQEVFTRVWLRAHRFDPEKGRAMTWLIAVARNHAIDRIRQRRETTADEGAAEAMEDSRPGALAGLVAKAEARRVIECLGTLEPDRAQAVQGAYLAGLSYQQLADRHGVPLNTMRTWLRRSLARLRECMGS